MTHAFYAAAGPLAVPLINLDWTSSTESWSTDIRDAVRRFFLEFDPAARNSSFFVLVPTLTADGLPAPYFANVALDKLRVNDAGHAVLVMPIDLNNPAAMHVAQKLAHDLRAIATALTFEVCDAPNASPSPSPRWLGDTVDEHRSAVVICEHHGDRGPVREAFASELHVPPLTSVDALLHSLGLVTDRPCELGPWDHTSNVRPNITIGADFPRFLPHTSAPTSAPSPLGFVHDPAAVRIAPPTDPAVTPAVTPSPSTVTPPQINVVGWSPLRRNGGMRGDA